MGKCTLILGGIRSGKSGFAEDLVKDKVTPVIYLATGQQTDFEMSQRIQIHQ